MVLPALEVKVTADTAQAEAGLERVDGAIAGVGTTARGGLTGMRGLSGAMSGVGRAAAANSNNVRMLSMQLSQVGQQAMASGNFVQALAIQLPDIGLAFGAVGTAVGLLAGIALPGLMTAFGDTSASADELNEALDSLRDMQDGIKAVTDTLKMSVDELSLKYGAAAESVRQFAILQAELRIAQANARLRDQADLLDDVTDAYQTAIDAGRSFRNTLQRIQDDFGLTNVEAREFESILDNLAAADTFGEQRAALEEIAAFLQESNVSIEDMPAGLAAALDEMINLSNEAEYLRNLLEGAAAAAGQIGSTTGTPLGLDGDLLPPASAGSSGGGRRRRGGGGSARENPLIRELESVRRALATEAQIAETHYEQQLETLQNALEQRLLTQEEFQNLSLVSAEQYAERMAAIDTYRYGDGLQKAGKFFGEMASAFQSGNEQMVKVAQTFAATEALINAWRAYSQTLADPSLPWFAKFAAAAKVLAAGISAVNAIRGAGAGSGGSTAGGAGAADAGQAPLDVRLSGIRPDQLYSGADVGALLDALSREAGDRGLRLTVAA